MKNYQAKIQFKDVDGVVYSLLGDDSLGVRFSDFQTAQFLELTEDIEKLQEGVRDKIVAEAHYLVSWLHRFPEIAFLFGIFFSHSSLIGFYYFIAAFLIEIFRFRVFGASRLASFLCLIWNRTKWPIFLILCLVLWPVNKILSLILVIFLIGQGMFMIISVALLFLMRVIVGTLAYYGLIIKDRRHWILHTEGLALLCVIDRWRMELLTPREALKFYPGSEKDKDVEFYELHSTKNFVRAYWNRPILNAVVFFFWGMTVTEILMTVYLVIIRNFMGAGFTLILAILSLTCFYFTHNWALNYEKFKNQNI